jgi:hypothetical protein
MAALAISDAGLRRNMLARLPKWNRPALRGEGARAGILVRPIISLPRAALFVAMHATETMRLL